VTTNVAYGKSCEGLCVRHGGKWCEFRKKGSRDLDLIKASFVCRPYSAQNPRRKQPGYDPMEAGGSETFHAVRDAILAHEPKYFLLENVDGVHMSNTAADGSRAAAPTTYMLDDDKYGLRATGK